MPRIRDKIVRLGQASHLAVITGLWYEWCLATPVLFGIDCVKREAVLFDDGETKISTSAWPQIGRAVAALLSLPISRTNSGGGEACLDDLRNKAVYIASFNVCQREMLGSVLRVMNEEQSSWIVKTESVEERFRIGLEARKTGTDREKGRQVYSRVFFPDGAGNHERTRGLANNLLGLPSEGINESTRIAVETQMASSAESVVRS